MSVRSRRRRSSQRRSINSFPTRERIHADKKKFALHAWSIDGKCHIDPAVLATLYNLALGAWIAWDDDVDERNHGRAFSDYVHLYPRPEGDYQAALSFALVAALNPPE